MRAEWVEWKPTRRDELISLAQYGKVTPEEAEAEAKASGFEPFERQPELPAFDPMQEPRWTIVQAIAWIAWRDLKQVRENCPVFRKECTHWLWREWNEPVENGTAFERRAGWFLESWREATTIRLRLLETILKSRGELPATYQMAVPQAEQALWHALADNHLIAEALNTDGRPVDIPAREWSYLKLYEDGKRDVLRYDALERREPFTDVKFRRDNLLRRWPPIEPQEDMGESSEYVEGFMLEPMGDPDAVGYVPLCVALHWVASSAGTMRVRLDDAEAWASAVAKLRPLLAGGDLEVIGLPGSGGLFRAYPEHRLRDGEHPCSAAQGARGHSSVCAVAHRLRLLSRSGELAETLQRPSLRHRPAGSRLDTSAGQEGGRSEPVAKARAYRPPRNRLPALARGSDAGEPGIQP